jgi:methyl-accepting chemotaxis protein
MTKPANQRKLRNYLINKQVQFRIILINLIFMCLMLMLTMVILMLYTPPDIYGLIDYNKNLASEFFYIPINIRLYLLIGATFILAIISQIWMSHKIVGPLINFTNHFKKIGEGDLTTKVILRKDDLLVREAEEFNAMIAALSAATASLKNDYHLLIAEIKDAAAEKKEDTPLKTLAEDHEQRLNQIIAEIKAAAAQKEEDPSLNALAQAHEKHLQQHLARFKWAKLTDANPQAIENSDSETDTGK